MCSCDDFVTCNYRCAGRRNDEICLHGDDRAGRATIQTCDAVSGHGTRHDKHFSQCNHPEFDSQASKILLQPSPVTLVYGSHAPANAFFFLTSLFIDSIHSISRNSKNVAQSMKNGRENRNHGNQEESGKKGRQEETLKALQEETNLGTRKASPKFFGSKIHHRDTEAQRKRDRCLLRDSASLR